MTSQDNPGSQNPGTKWIADTGCLFMLTLTASADITDLADLSVGKRGGLPHA